ncbi:hypothetical protein ACTHOQ_13885 [Solibacillus silvestris]|uniref:hypothetical protein n=1 Tax=Solibacillus silvestris TaxID=76853 RepID=UPI003F822D0F
MNQVGARLFYDKTDGEILVHLSEMQGVVSPRKTVQEIGIIDVPFGMINPLTHKIIGVNTVTNEPILEVLPIIETEEQRRIRELEDALLLQAESEVGGIL